MVNVGTNHIETEQADRRPVIPNSVCIFLRGSTRFLRGIEKINRVTFYFIITA